MATTAASKDRLSIASRTGFGIGDFGFNLYYTGLNLFLLYYYTDVLEIRPAIAGLIFALPLIWDAITDPLMGVIASRTRTRMGSYRPYIIFGTPFLALSFVLMFAAPLLFPGAVIAAAALSHVFFRTCYTVVSIPYTSLSANMTRDSGERGALAGVRMIFATLGGLFTVFLTLPLALRFGDGDLKLGFFWVAVAYAVIASSIFLVTFVSTKERADLDKPIQVSIASMGRLIQRNHALLILIGAIVMGATGSAIFSKALIYYVKYVAGLDLSITNALVALTASVSLSVPIWMLLSKFIAKRTAWLWGAGLALSMQAALYLFPPNSAGVFMALLVIMGLGNGAFVVTFWSMLPDTVEYGEWRSGVRDEGLVFGLNQLALKAASGLGIGVLGFALEAVGYIANQEQSDQTATGLRAISILVPFFCGLAAAALISMYPIDKALHSRLVRAIDYRQQRRQAT
ncbi:MAG: glycoside-pentoside-hexuronide (GPH):cation symporter [Henriciella sp.]|nr:glycoside-pentoside-hexuronide (GPH):cation symporter [Henriciella sp.]